MLEPRLSLLVVEAEPSLAKLLETELQSLAESTIAPSLKQGRATLAKQSFNAVLLDLRLPDGDGADLLGEISPRTPVIVLTNLTERDAAVAALARGAVDYLLIPFAIPELHHRLTRATTFRTLADESAALRQAAHAQPVLTLPQMEWHMIQAALAATAGNKTAAARRLGISLRTLYNKLEAKLAKS